MIRRLLLTLSLVAAPLAAQDPADAEPDEPAKESWVRSNASWGKFVTLGASGLMFTFAVINNNKAGDSFVTLETRCVLSQSLCEIDDNGEYINDVSESLFQETIDYDQAARAWLIGAQVALLATGVLWILDLTKKSEGPNNIPFTPFEVYINGDQARFGASFRF